IIPVVFGLHAYSLDLIENSEDILLELLILLKIPTPYLLNR
ncbi:unnamed protein product, partial [marine sediment metagenome]